mmetsp:Transcript_6121/g.17265  ORF Transcript_6121/g.17265 Transcript_6121/m.17265 type:complete len:232 (+) Transcript_6121:78-773(+)
MGGQRSPRRLLAGRSGGGAPRRGRAPPPHGCAAVSARPSCCTWKCPSRPSLSLSANSSSSSAATCSAVLSSASWSSGSARLSRRAMQTAMCPSLAAKCRALHPSSSTALSSALAHRSRLTHSTEPACAENIRAVMPTSPGSRLPRRPPAQASSPSPSWGFCGFITSGRRVSVHAPLSSAALIPFTSPWRAHCRSSWFSSTSSLMRFPPRFTVATACLTPSSSAVQLHEAPS